MVRNWIGAEFQMAYSLCSTFYSQVPRTCSRRICNPVIVVVLLIVPLLLLLLLYNPLYPFQFVSFYLYTSLTASSPCLRNLISHTAPTRHLTSTFFYTYSSSHSWLPVHTKDRFNHLSNYSKTILPLHCHGKERRCSTSISMIIASNVDSGRPLVSS